MTDDVYTPRGWALVVALWLTMIAPNAEVRAEAAHTARLVAKGLDAETIKACAAHAEAMANANKPSAAECLVDPVRSANLHDQGAPLVAATVIEADGSETFVLAVGDDIGDPSSTYSTSEPPAHECLGTLDDAMWDRIWGPR